MTTVENGKLIIGLRKCRTCWGSGTIAPQITCRICKGTGRGARGGRGGCHGCSGMRVQYDQLNQVTCPKCGGVNSEQAEQGDLYDYLPDDLWAALPMKVYRAERALSYNESFLGLGTVYSCEDYGRSAQMTDGALIAEVRRPHTVQGCKVAQTDGTLCDHVGIFTARNGYSVRAVFSDGPSAIEATIARERGKDEGRAVGSMLAGVGLNGTLGAVYR